MLIGREKELRDLEQFFQEEKLQLLILYGQKGIGKTALLKEFLKEKNWISYEAVSCSEKEQKRMLISHLKRMEFLPDSSFDSISAEKEVLSYLDILTSIEEKAEDKKEDLIFVIDEFQNLCKAEMEFIDSLKEFLERKNNFGKMQLIFCSSSVLFTEHFWEERLSELTEDLCRTYKIEELGYYEFSRYFQEFDLWERMEGYHLLGGIPGLWKQFDSKLGLRENVEKYILNRESFIFRYGEQYLLEELREDSVYNTILSALAKGNEKLNDIYLYTGFSRAKISVYLKNLMHLGLVEKISSVPARAAKGMDETKKGSYRICHSYIHFYYRYLFPNLNSLCTKEADTFYDEIIWPDFPCCGKNISEDNSYLRNRYKKICTQFIEKESEKGRLPGKFSYLGEWNGKRGRIDFIFQNEEEEILAGICCPEKKMMTYDQYQNFLDCLTQSQIEADFVILFSFGKFDNHLKEAAKKNPRVALLSIEQVG